MNSPAQEAAAIHGKPRLARSFEYHNPEFEVVPAGTRNALISALAAIDDLERKKALTK
jgi:hypothetical protein